MAAVLPLKNSSGQISQLQTGDIIPIANLATGTPDGTKFIRDDGTLQVPGGGGGGGTAATVAQMNTGTDNTTMGTPLALQTSKYSTVGIFTNLNFQ